MDERQTAGKAKHTKKPAKTGSDSMHLLVEASAQCQTLNVVWKFRYMRPVSEIRKRLLIKEPGG